MDHLIRTYVDSGVLIEACTGVRNWRKALKVIDDPDRAYLSSDFVKLEVLPKPTAFKNSEELEFYEQFFSKVVEYAELDGDLVQDALSEASKLGLGAVDALHLASAKKLGAHELVTTEKLQKPMHKSTFVTVKTIA